ncbi:hypothetical protein CONPUDRAFT_77906 [Coniophora puteana RWD-64-598 SS2]|uniref:Uncharacterized protein n=1 Tax=Coniophora puteana (strain RWD-64-598) TaxID=741705 RepID=R7SHT1_CONPW|nr:uncharacterized protein CONPUDRAFT_77906 [Coniophora puteana RWD-64-598 SS2]EIW74624.1 hypothetical protein CONPUDRAFT_77906 [Coniophora puteana RWD-64-598 SS2]
MFSKTLVLLGALGLVSAQSFTNQNMTQFSPSNKTLACGQTHSDTEYVVALQATIWSGGSLCNKTINISNGKGLSTNATVVDEFFTGNAEDLELAPSLFRFLTGPGVDVPNVDSFLADWSWVN